jgi:4-amino-4-deoxy-L-arabinose transferase-like glycosyltransferase
MKRLVSRTDLILLAIIILVAIFFRVFRLDTLPRGMTADEATFGLEGLAIARGERYPVFLRGMSGALPMYAYWLAILFRLLGPSIQIARLGTALVGIVTVLLFYVLVKELLASTGRERMRTVTALLATFFMATSYWHVVYSRLAIEPILVPLFGILIVYCVLRARSSGRRAFFVLSGLFLGLALYTYPAAYFFPVLVLALWSLYAWRDRQFLRTHWRDVLILFAVCFAFATPLGLFAARDFDTFAARASEVSVLNPGATGGSPGARLLTSFVETAGMFTFRGDVSLVRNPASRAVLDSLASIWFVLGLCVVILRYRETPHAILLTWWAMMCIPGLLTVHEIPHFSRTIGALPATCLLPALGMVSAWKWLEHRIASGRLLAILACLGLSISILFTVGATYRHYFVVWDTREDLRQGYDGSFTAAAAVMNQTQIPDSLWILPMTALIPSGYGGDHFDFLYHGSAPYYSVSLHEAAAPNELSTICRGTRRALVIDWKGYVLEEAYNAMAADPKGLIPFLFEKYGRQVDRNSYEAFDVLTYQLPKSPYFSIAENFNPLSITFGHELALTGMAFGGSSLRDISTLEEIQRRELPAGKSAWVVLRWQALAAPRGNYKVAVYLQDQGGHIAGQTDKLLLSNHLHPTKDWEAGQEEIDYYSLPSWAATAPGRYKVGVTLYDAETLHIVPTGDGQQTCELGTMKIVRPLVAPEVEPETAIQEDEGGLAPGIRFLGYDLPLREANPGDELSVACYWQALEDVNHEYVIVVQLSDDEGEVWAETVESPVYGTYPTTEWAEGEVLKDWHDISLPTDLPQGSYQVSLAISYDDSLLNRMNLQRIEIRGRAHQFIVPKIQYPGQAKLGQNIQFLGYDLSSDEVTAGGALQFTLYWQALRQIPLSYTVFTHLLDAEEIVWGQMDSIPQRGQAPTTSWVEGEIIADPYEIVVDEHAPSGEYVIEIGLYDAGSGERLPVYIESRQLEGDRLLLGPVHVAQ